MIQDMQGAEPLVSGTRLGQYELLMPLAKGGMGQIWVARVRGARGFRKLVAIKVQLTEMFGERFEQSMVHEASLASRIQHENVVETYELGEFNGILYMVMELVRGESLYRLCRFVTQTPDYYVPIQYSVNIVGQVCKGLHAAHELRNDNGILVGVVHRDVTPQNVLVSYDGVAKLLDFGIAKSETSALTQAGEVKGKLAYLAPEVIRNSADVDRRVDVFSLGVMLYWATTGVHPYKGADERLTMVALLNDTVAPRPSELCIDYPEALETVVMRAIAKNRNERYGTALEFLEALKEAEPKAFEPEVQEELRLYMRATLADARREQEAKLLVAQEMAEHSYERTLDRTQVRSVSPTAPTKATKRNRISLIGTGLLSVGIGLCVAAWLMAKPRVIERVVERVKVVEKRVNVEVPKPAEVTRETPKANPRISVSVPIPGGKLTSIKVKSKEKKETDIVGLIEEGIGPETATVVEPPLIEIPKAIELVQPLPPPPMSITPIVSSAPLKPKGPAELNAREGKTLLMSEPGVRIPPTMADFGPFEAKVRVCVGTSGKVKSAVIIKSSGGLDSAILQAIGRWVFKPYIESGVLREFCYPVRLFIEPKAGHYER